MTRRLFPSGSPYEAKIGFSRAVAVGGMLSVAGTAPIAEDGSVASPGDVYGQTRRCLETVRAAIEQAGFSVSNVVRTRILLTDVSRWEEAARAHGEMFAEVRPALTVMEVSGFIDPGWLVEIEADAVRADQPPATR
jgi:enamine deaminase RidA (YjgF/YER057c/UK114 family)